MFPSQIVRCLTRAVLTMILLFAYNNNSLLLISPFEMMWQDGWIEWQIRHRYIVMMAIQSINKFHEFAAFTLFTVIHHLPFTIQ